MHVDDENFIHRNSYLEVMSTCKICHEVWDCFSTQTSACHPFSESNPFSMTPATNHTIFWLTTMPCPSPNRTRAGWCDSDQGIRSSPLILNRKSATECFLVISKLPSTAIVRDFEHSINDLLQSLRSKVSKVHAYTHILLDFEPLFLYK